MQATTDPTADFRAPGGPAPLARPVSEPEPVLKSDDFGMLDLRGAQEIAEDSPGEIARDKDGRPALVLPMPKYKSTGNWRLRAKKDPWALYDGRR